jgi:hypothetical protein
VGAADAGEVVNGMGTCVVSVDVVDIALQPDRIPAAATTATTAVAPECRLMYLSPRASARYLSRTAPGAGAVDACHLRGR